MEQWQSYGLRVGAFLLLVVIFGAAAIFLIFTIASEPNGEDAGEAPAAGEVAEVGGSSITLTVDPDTTIAVSDGSFQTETPPEIQKSVLEMDAAPTLAPAKPTPLPTATPVPDQVIFVDYMVQAGDSLFSISSKLNSSIELLAMNRIDAGDLVANSVISVPVANPAFCPGTRAYVVRDRDTLYGIALSLNSSVEAIVAANNFPAGYLIKATEVICVP